MKKMIIAVALAGAALAGAGTASASNDAVTHVRWTGAKCIDVEVTSYANPRITATRMICGGDWSLGEGNIWSGDLFGANPIMGAADHIECWIERGDWVVWSSGANAGDGHDVNCLRRAT